MVYDYATNTLSAYKWRGTARSWPSLTSVSGEILQPKSKIVAASMIFYFTDLDINILFSARTRIHSEHYCFTPKIIYILKNIKIEVSRALFLKLQILSTQFLYSQFFNANQLNASRWKTQIFMLRLFMPPIEILMPLFYATQGVAYKIGDGVKKNKGGRRSNLISAGF